MTASHSLALSVWLRWREPDRLGTVFAAWRVAPPVGITSRVGSFCWFTAFALRNAAYVNALGQMERLYRSHTVLVGRAGKRV